jgi:hypothetical protein
MTHATPIRRIEFWITAAVAIIAGALAWLRLPPLTRSTVWAEDGTIFLNDAISGRPGEHLFAGYQGYLQFVPRVVADVSVNVIDLQHAAEMVTLLSCAIVGLAAALVFWCARDVVPSLALRIVLASITVLAPLVPIELLGNAANLHWFLLWMLLWVFLYVPRTRVGAFLLGVVALVSALSEIQLLFLLPLFLLRPGSRTVWPPRIGLAVGLVAQIVTTLLSPRPSHTGGLGGVLRNYVAEVVLPNFAANRAVLNQMLGPQAFLWEALALIPFLLALMVGLRFGTGLQRVAMLYLVPGSFLLWVGDAFLNGWGGSPVTYAPFQFVRYGVVPSMLMLASLVLAAQVLKNRPVSARRRPLGRTLGLIGVAALLVTMIVHFIPSETTRSHGPSWQSAISTAQTTCRSAPGAAVQPITTAPHTRTALWRFDIACSRLGR